MENSNYNNNHDTEEQALDLLEESWFFENLFSRSTRMSRCYSDPCTSSTFTQHVLAKDSSESTDDGSVRRCGVGGLVRAPSLPPCLGREEKVEERKSNEGRSKLNRQLSLQASRTTCSDRKSKMMTSGQSSSATKLVRVPSLPTSSVEIKELIQENDSDIRMSKLILQALADSSSDTFPPIPKAMGQCFSMQRCRPSRDLEIAESNKNGNLFQEMRRPYPNQKVLQKCHSDVAQLQGLRYEYKARRPILSEAWPSKGPPIPNHHHQHVSKNSAEDMKEKLKFWARAVATNVRQEC